MTRVGLSGCGAVSRLYYAPALRMLEHEGVIALVGVFDPDARSAIEFVEGSAARVFTRFDDLVAAPPDVLIIASPPKFHAAQAIVSMEHGINVHCEKPLALSAAEGTRMLETAQALHRRLTVGLMRRSFPAVRAIRDLLEEGAIGPLRSVEIFEGGPFAWPIHSPSYFTREESGGGVLRDIGSHVLDLLTLWLGKAELVAYSDDADGGVEANCLIELDYGGVDCSVRLSRDWARPNLHRFTGARGQISWTPYEPRLLWLNIGDAVRRIEIPAASMPKVRRGPAGDFECAFATALRDALAQEQTDAFEITRRSLALDTLELIDRCYHLRRPMLEPWRADDRAAS